MPLPYPRAVVAAAALVAAPLTGAVPAPLDAQQIDAAAGAVRYLGVGTGEEQQGSASLAARGVHSTGQTFLAPAATPRLDAFAFRISGYPYWAGPIHSGLVTFRAYVMQFDEAANRPVGPVLWTSAATPGTADATGAMNLENDPTQRNTTGWITRTFETGGLTLTPGASYVALLSTLAQPAGITDRWGTPSYGWALNQVLVGRGGGYAGGHLYRTIGYTYGTLDPALFQDFLSDGPDGDGTARNSLRYDDRASGDDAAFTATFGAAAVPSTTTPEPTAVALLAGGLLALGGARWRPRRSRAR